MATLTTPGLSACCTSRPSPSLSRTPAAKFSTTTSAPATSARAAPSPGSVVRSNARRVREARVYSEVIPHTASVEDVKAKDPVAIVLSGLVVLLLLCLGAGRERRQSIDWHTLLARLRRD